MDKCLLGIVYYVGEYAKSSETQNKSYVLYTLVTNYEIITLKNMFRENTKKNPLVFIDMELNVHNDIYDGFYSEIGKCILSLYKSFSGFGLNNIDLQNTYKLLMEYSKLNNHIYIYIL